MTEETTERTTTEWKKEGNLSYYAGISDLLAGLFLLPIVAKDKDVKSDRWTLVLDFDNIVAVSIEEQVNVGYSQKRLDQLRAFLEEYPETSVIIVTSRHLEYGWSTAEKWILETLKILLIGTTYDPKIMLHSLAYDPYIHLTQCIEEQNGPTRLIITGAAKNPATRAYETSIGHRSLSNFFIYDILNIGQFVTEVRLVLSIKTILQNQKKKGGGIVTIIDDGEMYPVVAEVAPSVENTETIYLHIKKKPEIGNPAKLTRGLLGMLAYAIKNGRKLTKTVNP